MDAMSVTSNEATEWRTYSKTRIDLSDHKANEKEWFAVKTAALLYLRGVNSKLEFQLVCDVQEALNFVDFELKYKAYDEPKLWRTSFIQLQPRTDVNIPVQAETWTNSESEAFSLQKYFKSFSYLKRKMENQDEGLLFGSIDRSDFVLYTDNRVNKELANRRRDQVSSPYGKFPISKETKSKNVQFTQETDKEDSSAMVKNEPEDKDILKKLMVFPGQPKETEMDRLITKELEMFCTYHKKHVNTIFSFFIEAVENWWRNDHVHFLNNSSSILENSIQHFAALCISSEQKRVNTIDITFNKNAIDSLKKTILLNSNSDKKLCRILTNRHSLKMSCSKALQILKSEGELCSFVSLDSLLNEQSIILPCWRSGRNTFLVIVCKSWSFKHDDLVNNIVSVLQEDKKKAIIVHCPRDVFADSLRKALKHRCEDYPDIFKTSQLSGELISRIAETRVVLQNASNIHLKDLIDLKSRPSEILMSNNFFEIFNKDIIYVGNKTREKPKYYIPRVLIRSNVLKKRILRTSPARGVIAVSGVPKAHLDQLVSPQRDDQVQSKCSFLYLAAKTASDDFNTVIKTTSDVHWLHMTDNNLEWKRSHGVVTHISKFIDNNKCSKYIPTTAFDVTNERIVLIAAERGSGKSTMLADIAYHTKKAHPATWVLLVKLGDNARLLRQDGDVNATLFLMAAAGIDAKSPLERDLFRFCVEQSGNVVVLLDGLNDLDSVHMDKVSSLLMSLTKTKVSKVWIATNFSTKPVLENFLSTFAFVIQKLSGDAEKIISRNLKRTYLLNHF